MKKGIGKKLAALRKGIKKLDGAIIAFSGGVDSTLLLRLAREELGSKAVAVTLVDENYPKADLKITRRLASLMNIKHVLDEKPHGSGCMGKFYGQLRQMGQKNNAAVLGGFHKDDPENSIEYVAATEMGVGKPFLECDLSKAEIRMLAREFGLPNYDIDTKGNLTTYARLNKLEKARRYLKAIGAKDCLLSMKGGRLMISCGKGTAIILGRKISGVEKKMKKIGFSGVVLKKA